MPKSPNPFYELYVGEQLKAEEFAVVFSPLLLENVDVVFRHGNVVVKGIKGAGKSMLLGLLKSDVRLAYSKLEDGSYPVPADARDFLTSSINLAQSGAISFGQRPIKVIGANAKDTLPLFFGDFVNYWLVRDLLKTIRSLCAISEEGGPSIDLEAPVLEKFCQEFLAGDVWSGYFSICEPSLEAINQRIEKRLSEYREYLNFNLERLPSEVLSSKTTIGEPLAFVFDCLVKAGVLQNQTRLIVIIDQYEELADIDSSYDSNGRLYRRVINSALKRRDPRLSYRIGTRGYAWQTEVEIHGTTGVLEDERDYKLVDLDSMLRRPENQAHTWIFPDFAGEVLCRRLSFSGVPLKGSDGKQREMLEQVFGKSLTLREKGRYMAGKSPTKAVKLADSWPKAWKDFILEAASSDPLTGRLIESWLRQQQDKSGQVWKNDSPKKYQGLKAPWARTYWQKERNEQALLQIATRCQQRIRWSGSKDILALSGGNILIFLALCQHIWDFLLKSNRSKNTRIALPVDTSLQSIGIHEASERWVDRIIQSTGRSYERHKFIEYLGAMFRKWLSEDIKQSYPGHNGFSVLEKELDENPEIKSFLEECCDYGNLVSLPHTTRSKDMKPRRKFYLAPVYSPKFRITVVRNKEPRYVRIFDVQEWLRDAGVQPSPQGEIEFEIPRS